MDTSARNALSINKHYQVIDLMASLKKEEIVVKKKEVESVESKEVRKAEIPFNSEVEERNVISSGNEAIVTE